MAAAIQNDSFSSRVTQVSIHGPVCVIAVVTVRVLGIQV